MAWSIRRTFRFPLGTRVNLSKHGVGYSIGFPGYRRGVDSLGRSYRVLSIPGTGLYNRVYGKPRRHHAFGLLVFIILLAMLKVFFG